MKRRTVKIQKLGEFNIMKYFGFMSLTRSVSEFYNANFTTRTTTKKCLDIAASTFYKESQKNPGNFTMMVACLRTLGVPEKRNVYLRHIMAISGCWMDLRSMFPFELLGYFIYA